MKAVQFTFVLFLFCQYISVSAQDTNLVKKYFFGSRFVKNGHELVVITKEPQTELAREIGSRIYSDTATLRYIEQQFFCWKRKDNEIHHYCGHDLYFYLKKGDVLEYISCANSNCGFTELGSGNGDFCSNVEFLANNGTRLVADTIRQLPDSIKTKAEMREVYFRDHIYSEFRDNYLESIVYGNLQTKSFQNVPFYYDGYLQFDVPKEWLFEEEKFLKQQLHSMGIDVDLSDPRINWDCSWNGKTYLYFTSDHPLFDAEACKPLPLPKPGYRFSPPLLIWRVSS